MLDRSKMNKNQELILNHCYIMMPKKRTSDLIKVSKLQDWVNFFRILNPVTDDEAEQIVEYLVCTCPLVEGR